MLDKTKRMRTILLHYWLYPRQSNVVLVLLLVLCLSCRRLLSPSHAIAEYIIILGKTDLTFVTNSIHVQSSLSRFYAKFGGEDKYSVFTLFQGKL